MTKLLVVLSISMVLTYSIEHRDRYMLKKTRGQKCEVSVTVLLILFLGIYTGLRTWYNDTVTYISMYNSGTPVLRDFFSYSGTKFSQGMGFLFVNSALKTIGASSQDFIMFYGLLTMALYISFFHKEAEDFTFSMYLFFTVGCFVFAQAAIKQSMAMALGCWVYHYAAKKDWKRYAAFCVLACLFHPYAIVYLLIPLMRFRPWVGRFYIWVLGFTIAGFGLDYLMELIINITGMMGANYGVDEFSGEGVNIFRLLVCLVPTLFSFLFKGSLFRDCDDKGYLLMNLTMINGMIMFVGLFGTANYFARLANFFLPMQALAIPWIANRLKRNNKQVITIAGTVCYFGYFFYESAILRPFDNGFAQISLFRYLEALFS